jgi:hypothetical protein
MRLASVTVSSMKKYAVLCAKKGGVVDGHDGQDILLGMHAEVCIFTIFLFLATDD